jgi:hypothetical protein
LPVMFPVIMMLEWLLGLNLINKIYENNSIIYIFNIF